jgi:hypothetical protein
MATPGRRKLASKQTRLLLEKKLKDELSRADDEEPKKKNPEDVKNLFDSIVKMKKKIKDKEH